MGKCNASTGRRILPHPSCIPRTVLSKGATRGHHWNWLHNLSIRTTALPDNTPPTGTKTTRNFGQGNGWPRAPPTTTACP